MQLFTIGLYVLNEDGTQVIDSTTGKPKETYTNEDIESFARAWTGFDRQAARGNYEDRRGGSTDNRLDAMKVIAAYRDPLPKANLAGCGVAGVLVAALGRDGPGHVHQPQNVLQEALAHGEHL